MNGQMNAVLFALAMVMVFLSGWLIALVWARWDFIVECLTSRRLPSVIVGGSYAVTGEVKALTLAQLSEELLVRTASSAANDKGFNADHIDRGAYRFMVEYRIVVVERE